MEVLDYTFLLTHDHFDSVFSNFAGISTMLYQGSQERLFYENLELAGEQGDREDKQFAFPTQCLVMGDFGVGKTSLVKSLTGEPFDPHQPKTQGIDHRVVDHEWKNFNLTDLVFGDLWRFLKTGEVEVALIGAGRANSPVVVRKFEVITGLVRLIIYFCALTITAVFLMGTVYNLNVAFLLFYFIYYGHLLFQCCTFQFDSTFRFILASSVFILSRPGLITGLYLGLRSHMYEGFVEFALNTRAHILLGIVVGIAFVTLVLFLGLGPLQLPFGLSQLVKNQIFIVIVCFYRLLLSIFIGSLFGFLVGISFRNLHETCDYFSKTLPTCNEYTGHLIYNLLSSFFWEFPLLFLEIKYLRHIFFAIKEKTSGWTFIILLVIVFFCHCKLAWTSPEEYFQISFPLYICFTLYQEWTCTYSVSNEKDYLNLPNRYMTLALWGTGEMNSKMLKSALKEKFPSLKLKILDFAGDKEYYAFHHMFLKSQAIYVIVFNITNFVENNFKNINACIARLQFWLEPVCSHVPRKTPIFLVGTHRGDMDKNYMEGLNSHLITNLWNPYCDELVINEDDELIFFPVENSNGKYDVGVQILQTKVMSIAKGGLSTIDCEIPLSWITIQDAIIHLREKKDVKFCVTLEEFPTVFGNFICTNCSEETLKYFHEKGLIIYLDKDPKLPKWVLLKPEILVDIIIQLVVSPQQMMQERGFRRDWNLLHDEGKLTSLLLTRTIFTVQENEEAMTAFLEEYDLICPLLNKKVQMSDDEQHQPTHFVPALLPMSADSPVPVWHDDPTDKKFYVFFKRFLPEPLFHRLLSRAHKLSKIEYPNGQPVVCRDAGIFWMSPSPEYKQPYRLRLLKEEAMIEVTFSSR